MALLSPQSGLVTEVGSIADHNSRKEVVQAGSFFIGVIRASRGVGHVWPVAPFSFSDCLHLLDVDTFRVIAVKYE